MTDARQSYRGFQPLSGVIAESGFAYQWDCSFVCVHAAIYALDSEGTVWQWRRSSRTLGAGSPESAVRGQIVWSFAWGGLAIGIVLLILNRWRGWPVLGKRLLWQIGLVLLIAWGLQLRLSVAESPTTSLRSQPLLILADSLAEQRRPFASAQDVRDNVIQ